MSLKLLWLLTITGRLVIVGEVLSFCLLPGTVSNIQSFLFLIVDLLMEIAIKLKRMEYLLVFIYTVI